MATPEQKAASRKVMDAVTALNSALNEASSNGLHVRLETVNEFGRRNPNYVVAEIETRKTVLP
ncbi:hypothetical protein BSN85_36485 [Bradyrhizobium brasilense]|uniref:hypothetical protein n=1 Tax=Bradyrhizobium brasilense TaxID=1419277 RepID=UPI000978D0A3|nr:hypothetical protein [Bradyrhizobium brasilense]OMH99553.1 hypothetical protein BSN85_36485 [Bradyrhizobium brasilense]